MRSWAALSAVVLLAACGECSSTPDAAPTRPNVLLVTIDTLRADRLGCYGYSRAKTPHIDRLAREGVRAAHAVAVAPITMPSHASILSGLYPPAHGVRGNGAYQLPGSVTTLQERLQKRGWTTQAFVSAVVLARQYNLSQGFDGYDDDLSGEEQAALFLVRDRKGMRTAELAVDWLERWSRGGRRKPFFLWVHLFDPHLPYEAPEIDRRGAATPYDAEVTTADRATGRIVDWLRRQRLIDETFVALTSDHGESLGEHEERTHSVFVYEATMHVPFIVRYPPLLPRGRVHRPTVRGVDLAPTLLRALGLPGTRDSQGADLLAALAGRERGPELDAYSESLVSEIGFGMAPLHAIRRGPWTYVRAPRPELYDRSRDPRELENLYDAQRARAAELDRALETVLADSARRSHRVDARALDRTTSDQLQALGYLADPGTRTSMSGMDPKDGIRIYARIEQARGLARREQYDAAIEILLGVLGDTPNNVTALNALALCYLRENEPGEAESVYRRSFALDASQHHVLVSIARIRRRARDFADARALLDRALAIVPSSVDVLAERGITERDAGDADAAQRWLRRAVEADPQSSRAQHLYGQSLLEHGDARGARDWLTRALARSPRNYDALMQAGVASERLDDLATAASFYRRAGEVRRDAWRPPLDLARLRARAGDLEGAIRELERATQIGCSDVALVNGDEWLAPVRSDPRFAAMLERIRANAEAWRRRREER